jgi:hypothetical protein
MAHLEPTASDPGSEEALLSLLGSKIEERINTLVESFKTLQENQTFAEEKIKELLPQARSLFMAKLLTRLSALCLSPQNPQTSQETEVLLSVVNQLSPSSSIKAVSGIDKQVQEIQNKAAEFHKQVAQKEKIIADKITKSQQHIAGIQQKMTRK